MVIIGKRFLKGNVSFFPPSAARFFASSSSPARIMVPSPGFFLK